MDAGLSIPGVLPRAIALGLFAALCAFPLKAQTLLDDFQKGLERDAEYQSALAQRDAGLEPLE
ncbi:MAG: hypothetical protein EB069_06280, partial [Actinobacteria bacterium]|nr:hypothetical protein [Actinomycetota bacterium]